MAYEIRIRGHKEPVVVESNAEKLRSDWEEYQISKTDKIVEVGSWVGRLSLIQDFKKAASSSSNQDSSSYEIHRDYVKERNNILSLSPKERSERMGFFRMIYWGFTKKNSEDVKTNSGVPIEELAQKIQSDFFTKNPQRTMCDPVLFKPIINSTRSDKSTIYLAENMITQDRFAVKNFQ